MKLLTNFGAIAFVMASALVWVACSRPEAGTNPANPHIKLVLPDHRAVEIGGMQGPVPDVTITKVGPDSYLAENRSGWAYVVISGQGGAPGSDWAPERQSLEDNDPLPCEKDGSCRLGAGWAPERQSLEDNDPLPCEKDGSCRFAKAWVPERQSLEDNDPLPCEKDGSCRLGTGGNDNGGGEGGGYRVCGSSSSCSEACTACAGLSIHYDGVTCDITCN